MLSLFTSATKPRSRSQTPEKSDPESSAHLDRGGSRFLKKPASQDTLMQPGNTSVPVAAPRQQSSQKPNVEQSASVNKAQAFRFTAPLQAEKRPSHAVDDSDSSSMSLGKGGARFMKKKPVVVTDDVTNTPEAPPLEKKKPKVNRKQSSKYDYMSVVFC